MMTFLLGCLCCLCGFVFTILILFLYAALRVGGESDE